MYQTAIANVYHLIAVIHSLKHDYWQTSFFISRKAMLFLGKHRYCWKCSAVTKKTLLCPRKHCGC